MSYQNVIFGQTSTYNIQQQANYTQERLEQDTLYAFCDERLHRSALFFFPIQYLSRTILILISLSSTSLQYEPLSISISASLLQKLGCFVDTYPNYTLLPSTVASLCRTSHP